MTAWMDLLEAYAAAHPDQVARTLETADPEAAATTLLELEPAEAALVLQHVAPPAAARLLERLPSSSGKRLLEELRDDVAAALLRRVPESARADLLAALPTSRRRALDRLLRARPATAAAHVIPSVIALPSEVTAGAAIDRVRAEPQASSHHVYVIDSRHRLIGVVTLGALLRADPGATLRAVMRARPDAVYGHAGVEACVRHPAWRRLSELPVVDRDGVLLGVLHYETLRRMESQLGRGPVAGGVVTTGTALAELYATGLFATTRWAGSLFRAPAMSSRVPDDGGQR